MKKVCIIFFLMFMTFSFVSAEPFEIFDNHGAVMMMINPEDGSIIYANKAATIFYQYSNEELIKMNVADINTLSEDLIKIEMDKAVKEERNYFKFEHQLKDGSIRYVEVYSYPVEIKEKKMLFSIIVDITEKVGMERDLIHFSKQIKKDMMMIVIVISFFTCLIFGFASILSFYNIKLKRINTYDYLTDVYNRMSIKKIYEKEVKKNKFPMAFFMIDVNNLKLINDTYGHLAGDQMLIKTSQIIKKIMYNESYFGRVSGDEFVLIAPKCGEMMAMELYNALMKILISIQGVHFSVAIGYITLFKENMLFDEAFLLSERNMYLHKTSNKKDVNSRIEREMIHILYEVRPLEEDRIVQIKKVINFMIKTLKLSDEDSETLLESCELQDIGYIVISEDPEEHVQKTQSILTGLNKSNNCINTCFYHHESYDGRGYPNGLKAFNIPRTSRVLTLSNFLVDELNYSNSVDNTISKFINEKGRQLDPDMINAIDLELLSTLLIGINKRSKYEKN